MQILLASMLVLFETAIAQGLSKAIVSQPDGASMILIPEGEFIYGADPEQTKALEKRLGANWDDRIDPSVFPKTRITLQNYYVDQYDVTNERYAAFAAATGHARSRYYKFPQLNAPQQPVVGVGWDDAIAYCAWSGKRLLTEEEWEKAARGTDGRIWPWGNELLDSAYNGRISGLAAPSAVGSFPKGNSPYGVADMAGNVWQMTSGEWQGIGRAMRGGSYLNRGADVRTTARWSPGEEKRGTNWLGFRCAMDAVRK